MPPEPTIHRSGSFGPSGSTPQVDLNAPTTPVAENPVEAAEGSPLLEAMAADRPVLAPSGADNKGIATTDAVHPPTVEADARPASGWRENISKNVGYLKTQDKDNAALTVFHGLTTGSSAGVINLKNDAAMAGQIAGDLGLLGRTSVQVGRAVLNPLVKVGSDAAKLTKDNKEISSWMKLHSASADLKMAGQGVNAAGAALSLLSSVKTTAELGRDFFGDVAASPDRTELHHLLKDYDPATHKLKDSEGQFTIDANNHPKYQRIQELMNAKGADRSRTQAQAACDRLTQVKDITINNSQAASAIMATVGKDAVTTALGSAAGKAVPGVGAAVSLVAAGHATWKAAVNITALNNVRMAEDNAKDDLWLKAISTHIKQERLHNSRTNLATAGANAVSGGLGIAALAAGPGAPAALTVASLCGAGLVAGVGIGVAAFEIGHKAVLAKRREGAEDKFKAFEAELKQEGADKAKLMASLSDGSKIGIAEHALLSRLRGSDPAAREAAVKFLEDFGLTKGTIVKLQTKPAGAAMEALRTALYTDKVSLRGNAIFYSLGSLGRVFGIVQAGRAIKNGFNKLADKITASVTPKPGSGIELPGASNVRGGLKSPEKFSLDEMRTAFKLRGLPPQQVSNDGGAHRARGHSRVAEELSAVGRQQSTYEPPQVRSLFRDADDLEVSNRNVATS